MNISEELQKALEDSKEHFLSSYTPIEKPTKLSLFDDSDFAMSFLMETQPTNIKMAIKSLKEELIEEVTTTIENKKHNIVNELTGTIVNTLYDTLSNFIETQIKPVDEMYQEVVYTYNGMVRMYKKIADPSTNENTKKELTEKYKEYIKEIYEKSAIAAQILALSQFIDSLKAMLLVMKNARNATKESFEKTAGKLKTTTSIFEDGELKNDDTIKNILSSIGILLPIFLGIGAAFLTNRDVDDAINRKAIESYEEDKTKEEDKAKEEDNAKEQSNINSEIVSLANKNAAGFSYTKLPGNVSNEIKQDTSIEYINICISEGPVSEIEPLKTNFKIIEIDNKEPKYTYYINENSTIKYGDVIGMIGDEPIKTKFGGIVHKMDKNVLVIKSDEDSINEDYINSLVKNASEQINTKSEIDKIIDKFDELNKVENVIKSYVAFMFLPKIPNIRELNTETQSGIEYNAKSKDFIYDTLKEEFNKIHDKYNERIIELCGADSVKAYTESDRLIDLKNEILNEKAYYYRNIFDLYENFQQKYGIYCYGKETDYMILSEYMEFMDNIDYEDDYIETKKIKNTLYDIIKRRAISEKTNKSTLISSFNDICDNVIGKYWNDKSPYYTVFDSLFTTDEEKGLIESVDNIDPIYKKLYNYIASITNVPGISDNKNVTTENQNKNDKILSDGIKRICRRFITIKGITNNQNTDVQIDINTLTKTEQEAIDSIYNTLKEKYTSLCNITDDSTFNVFKEAVITKMEDVYYNNIKHEHYYISTQKQASNISTLPVGNTNNNGLDSDSSPNTNVKISDMKYWLKYCTYATLTNTTLPIYWSCGLIAAGAPVPMPIIYIPIYYLDSKVSILFGLGICGISIYPMIVFMNFSTELASLIIPINMITDQLYKSLDDIKENAMNKLQEIPYTQMKELKESKKGIDDKIRKINMEISKIKEDVLSNGKVVKEIKKRP